MTGKTALPVGAEARLFSLVTERTGLEVPANRVSTWRSALDRAFSESGARSAESFEQLLRRDASVFDALVDRLTVGETYFFREPRQLEFLREHAIPDIMRRRGAGHALSVWSAGCATGEEAYTLAILLRETAPGAPHRVLGTDVSRRRLEIARAGRYGKWSLRGVPAALVNRHFSRAGKECYEVRAADRALTSFAYGNLAECHAADAVERGLDLIVCRNVMIYLDAATSARVFATFVDRLRPGGWLLLGPSDPSIADTSAWHVVVTDAGVAYRRRSPALPAAVKGTMTDLRRVAERPAVRRVPREPATFAPIARPVAPREEARRAAPATVQATVQAVRALADAGQARAGAAACAAALDAHPECAELNVLQSLLATELGDTAGAIAAARRALYLDRGLVLAHVAYGAALRAAGEGGAARRAFVAALQLLDGRDPDAEVEASGGVTANRLAMLARDQLEALPA